MTMKAYGDGSESALAAAEKRIRELETELSVTDKNSDISRINMANGADVKVSQDTVRLVEAGKTYWQETAGALDDG